MPSFPTVEDVARVERMTDLVERNREVTRGYYRFSQYLAARLGGDLTWPTLATWASAQAGCTIRKEDLLRTLERRLGDSPAVRRLVRGPFRLTATFVLDAILQLNPFERSSQAVSRGNIKVYAEIGAAFARYLTLLEAGAGATAHERFIDGLRAGPSPDGQDSLKDAFRAYTSVLALEPGKARSECILLGNLSIGFHEQIRLQPEIEASVDGSVLDGIEIKNRLFDRLLPLLAGARQSISRAALRAALDPLLTPVVSEVQALVRSLVTESLMVLELPGETLRLGDDLSGQFPLALQHIDLAAARRLLEKVDPTLDSLAGSSARNWADFPERMHFIADLFRSRQQTARLFEAPADCAQLLA